MTEPTDARKRVHLVKCWPSYFQAILDGRKTFEVRRNDRDYSEGDVIRLREYEPEAAGQGRTTGRVLRADIGYVLNGTQWGVAENHVVFALLDVEQVES